MNIADFGNGASWLHERDRHLRRWVGFGSGGGDGLPDAAASAAGGGIRFAEDVSGVRVDYAPGQGGLSGVREGVCRSGFWTLAAVPFREHGSA